MGHVVWLAAFTAWDLAHTSAPQEIEEFCKSVTGGASEGDPFEGLSPQEIDAYIEKHGLPAGLDNL
jgi:hypothetical protein